MELRKFDSFKWISSSSLTWPFSAYGLLHCAHDLYNSHADLQTRNSFFIQNEGPQLYDVVIVSFDSNFVDIPFRNQNLRHLTIVHRVLDQYTYMYKLSDRPFALESYFRWLCIFKWLQI